MSCRPRHSERVTAAPVFLTNVFFQFYCNLLKRLLHYQVGLTLTGEPWSASQTHKQCEHRAQRTGGSHPGMARRAAFLGAGRRQLIRSTPPQLCKPARAQPRPGRQCWADADATLGLARQAQPQPTLTATHALSPLVSRISLMQTWPHLGVQHDLWSPVPARGHVRSGTLCGQVRICNTGQAKVTDLGKADRTASERVRARQQQSRRHWRDTSSDGGSKCHHPRAQSRKATAHTHPYLLLTTTGRQPPRVRKEQVGGSCPEHNFSGMQPLLICLPTANLLSHLINSSARRIRSLKPGAQ